MSLPHTCPLIKLPLVKLTHNEKALAFELCAYARDISGLSGGVGVHRHFIQHRNCVSYVLASQKSPRCSFSAMVSVLLVSMANVVYMRMKCSQPHPSSLSLLLIHALKILSLCFFF